MSKKIITNKQHIILLLLLLFRFLNSKQIQQFLNHKDHRRINTWLKDLTEKRFIERDFKPVFGMLTKPAVYVLTTKGRKYIKDYYPYNFPQYLKRIARDAKASKSFRVRCQVLADWYLVCFPHVERKQKIGETGIAIVDKIITQLTTDTDGKEEKIPMNTFEFFTPSYFPQFILLEKIKPDAYVRIRRNTGMTHSLLFVLDAYIPKFLLNYTLKHIFQILEEEYWEDTDSASLHFYFVCPNNAIIVYLRRLLPSWLERYYSETTLVFHFATRNQLYKQKNKGGLIKWITISSSDH